MSKPNLTREGLAPWFLVAVDAAPGWVPASAMTHKGDPAAYLNQSPQSRFLAITLDGLLIRRRRDYRVCLYTGTAASGVPPVGEAVRAYCDIRGFVFGVEHLQRDVYGEGARRRQLLWMTVRCHAVVWFGAPDPDGVDLPSLADRLGVPSRAYPVCDVPAVQPVARAIRLATASRGST